MPGSRAAATLALLILSTALTCAGLFAIGELALRLRYDANRSYRLSELIEFESERGWHLRPGSYRYFHPMAFTSARVEINELRLRTRSLASRVPAGGKRISVVGDSFVFSEALSEGEKFTDRLEQLAGPTYQVVNISVPGYGTGQQILMLESLASQGLELGEKVVHIFFTNDILDNLGMTYGTLRRDLQKPVFGIGPEGIRVVSRAVKPESDGAYRLSDSSFLSRSLCFGFLRNRAELLASRFPITLEVLAALGLRVSPPRLPGILPAWYETGWQQRWELTADLLEYMAGRVAAWGASDFLIVFMPSPFQVEEVFEQLARTHADEPLYAAFLEDLDRPQRTLLDFCVERGLRCLDLTGYLRERRSGSPAYFLREGHLNEHGSEIVARALFENLIGR
jgi:hypothetical protein